MPHNDGGTITQMWERRADNVFGLVIDGHRMRLIAIAPFIAIPPSPPTAAGGVGT